MRHWLMKTEPEAFSVEDLAAAPRRTSAWDGVRNYQARNMLRDEMRRGDQVFLYYSSCEVPGIVAIMQVVKQGYPDPTAFDRKHHHYDAGSDRKNPRWFMVDVQLKRPLARTITLTELRAHAGKELKGMVLLRPGNRLSITPVEEAHWQFILSLE
jgi:predicted RNA-binding protein with PUA-like domain